VDVEQVPHAIIKLKDQFGTSETPLRLPLYFAVPVTKRHDSKDFPIRNKTAHLLIFSINVRNVEKKITLRNQFSRGTSVNVVRSVMLAVPSLKREWKPA
jgi:hypothetical protein